MERDSYGEQEYSLSDLVGPVVRRWRAVLLIVGFALFLAVVRIMVATPQYEAVARLIVLAPNQAVGDLQTLQLYRNLVPAYREILASRRAMDAVLKELDLNWSPDTYRRRVRIEADEDSQTLAVIVRAPSPEEAAGIATGAAEIMTRVAAEVMQEERLVILDVAAPPEQPVSPRPIMELTLATALGLMSGTVFAYLIELLDRRIRDEETVQRRLGLPVLGVIPHIDQ